MYLINVRLTEGAIKNGQSRDTINIGYTRHKTKKPTQYVLDTTMYKTKDEDKKAQKQPTKKPNKAQYLLYTNIRKQTQIT